MTLRHAVERLNDLMSQLEASGMGRGPLEGATLCTQVPLARGLAVEMTALYIAIRVENPRFFHYKAANWLPRAIYQMQWTDSLDWWARVADRGFDSKHKGKHPIPQDLDAAISKVRNLIHSQV